MLFDVQYRKLKSSILFCKEERQIINPRHCTKNTCQPLNARIRDEINFVPGQIEDAPKKGIRDMHTVNNLPF